jgi:hypothetical protein
VLTVKNADGILGTIKSYSQSTHGLVGVAGYDNCFRKVLWLENGKIARQRLASNKGIWEKY